MPVFKPCERREDEHGDHEQSQSCRHIPETLEELEAELAELGTKVLGLLGRPPAADDLRVAEVPPPETEACWESLNRSEEQ